jgi:hypothetical protein
LEGEDRDILFRATVYDAERDFSLQGSYYELLKAQKDFSLEFDPFYSTVLDQFPYSQTRWLLSKGLTEHFNLQGGVESRQVEHHWQKGAFNRDFERYFVTPSVDDLPIEGMSASLTGETWNGAGRDIETWGGEISHRCTERLKGTVGTSYALYKYDYYSHRERDHVRTYYFGIDHKWTESIDLGLKYEFEDDGFEEYQTLNLEGKWSF